jgi:uncharacterized protein YndB with AHSA1/START domain
MENNVKLHRVIKASPEKVFRAFSNGAALASWLARFVLTVTVHEIVFRVGGGYKMSFTNFSTGSSHSFGGKYLEIKPNEFLKYTDQFDDPNLPGQMITTIRLRKVLVGTELEAVQTGIPAAIPAEMCYLGWQESIEKLVKLVEPEIPDA